MEKCGAGGGINISVACSATFYFIITLIMNILLTRREFSIMRTEGEIKEYEAEAFDVVWLIRKQQMFTNILLGVEAISTEQLETVMQAIDEICLKRDIDFQEPVSDWGYGYWSGILAALRWVMGDEKNFFDI